MSSIETAVNKGPKGGGFTRGALSSACKISGEDSNGEQVATSDTFNSGNG